MHALHRGADAMPNTSTQVNPEDRDTGGPQPGTGLCMSGGGYRAMVFHLGALWRLYEAGVLKTVDRVSSVSGGSITAGLLGLRWTSLRFDPAAVRTDFVPQIVDPIRALASETIDAEAIITGLALPGNVGERVAAAYDEHLFHGATLQDLPDAPRFVINATNVQSGALWRFSKPYMGDYRVGLVKTPTLPLAQAVAASSAFPPVLSPVRVTLDPATFTPDPACDLQRTPFTSKVVLSDGGVYDNLGLEPVFKRYRTVLVSDGGGKMQPEEEPKLDWGRHAYRVLDMVDNQVRSLRKRELIDALNSSARAGAYWGIRTAIADYQLQDPLDCPIDKTTELASLATRLKRLDDRTQERLINWGYAVCDAALRKHVNDGIPRGSFPFPSTGV
jgi:NTE family protein